MRKRAQRRSTRIIEEPKHIVEKTRIEKKPLGVKKNWWVAISLVGIFLLVLFLNAYFNIASEASINQEGKNLDKFYLSGPDPYYNMRLVNVTVATGRYPFYSENDPLLNYPIGTTGSRPPLLNMIAIGFSRILTPFMSETDALGYSMQFVSALFGALIVFPVYFIGKTLFGKKAGLVAAFLIAIIPIHLGSGHGSAYSLFDHDSLNLLLFFLAFLFLIKGIKEKNSIRSVLYALLSGVSLAALTMTWTESQFLYVVIAVYVIIQMLIDIFTDKLEIRVVRTSLVVLLSGYLISLPIRMAKLGGFNPDIPLFLCLGIAVFGLLYLVINRMRVPWTVSLPAIFCAGGIVLVFLFLVRDLSSTFPFLSPLNRISDILLGGGIYGTKVALTIAEAGTYNISRTVMSFGPALYWLGCAGFVLLIYRYYKDKQRRDFLFIIILFIVDMWLAGTAGRFLNDIVPLIAIFSGWIVWMTIDRIDYKQMIRNIRSAGGGIHGLRRGVKIFHIFGILFIAFLVILPNAYLAFDAAIPAVVTKNGTSNMKIDFFGEDHSSAFGLGHGKEAYWVNAYNWLNEQDTEIEDPTKRPAFISWWDYGFYEVAVGGHPTVADNFQDGIPPAANFHTATSEKEAVVVWIVRLLEGNRFNNKGKLSEDVVLALEKHVGKNDTENITKWIEYMTNSPSYNAPIGEEYDEELSKKYRVGEQYGENAYYHDISDLLTNKLDDEGITWLYHDIQDAAGYSIRYYGVEGYDKQIFNIFGFLADKSLLLVAGEGNNPEDDFVKIFFTGYYVDPDTGEKLRDGEWTSTELNEMPLSERRNVVVTNTRPQYKDAYFDTMFYRTYIGLSSGESGNKQEIDYQFPCIDMKHFYAEFISEYPRFYYYSGKSAVVIAKYYEGAYVNGSVTFMGEPVQAQVVVQKNITHYGISIPVDHDKADIVNGSFNLTAGAGSITLQIRRNTELGANAFILKNVTFAGPDGSEFAPITDAEAMRTNGTNYERAANITIDPANVEGYVYVDKDDVDGYNTSVDESLANVKITLYEIEEFTEEGATSIERESLTTDENGYYNTSGLMPGFYMVRAELDDFFIHESLTSLYPGNNSFNISKYKPAAVEGKVYYDSNNNNEYDAGEEMNDVKVDIIYKKLAVDGTTIIDTIFVDTIQTDDNGAYSFSSLVPGQYIIDATKLKDYKAERDVTLEENKTTTFDISMDLYPVVVSGYTRYGNNNTGNISILFSPDVSVENNTAISIDVASDATGYYEVDLTPGHYNVTVDQLVNESGQNVTYSYSGSLEVKIGEVSKYFDILLTRVES